MNINIDFARYDNEWRDANTNYLRYKAQGMKGEDLQFFRSVALLRAQLRAVAYLYKNDN